MDECCKEFCQNLDEWIQDEENDEKKYHTWAEKARKNNQPYIGILLDTISTDEGKHARALTDVAMMVCSEPNKLLPYQERRIQDEYNK